MGKVKHGVKLLQSLSRIDSIAFGDLELGIPVPIGTGLATPRTWRWKHESWRRCHQPSHPRLAGKEKKRVREEWKQRKVVRWKERKEGIKGATPLLARHDFPL